MSASNVTSDTAEAGLFQTSWNFHVCCTDTVDLLNEYYIGLGEEADDLFKGIEAILAETVEVA
jgi:hypothetical protein